MTTVQVDHAGAPPKSAQGWRLKIYACQLDSILTSTFNPKSLPLTTKLLPVPLLLRGYPLSWLAMPFALLELHIHRTFQPLPPLNAEGFPIKYPAPTSISIQLLQSSPIIQPLPEKVSVFWLVTELLERSLFIHW